MRTRTVMKSLAAAAIATLTFGAMAEEMKGVQLWEGGPEWATCNIGASSETDFGYYFYWGSPVGYKMKEGSFGPSSGIFTVTEWSMSTSGTTKTSPFNSSTCPTVGKTLEELYAAGYTDQSGKLTPTYDAAHAILGGDWRMPTQAEIEDLSKNCTVAYLRNGREDGRLVFTGKGAYSNVSITIPAAGIAGCSNDEETPSPSDIRPYERVCIWTCQTSSGTTKSVRLYAKYGSPNPNITYPATDRFYGLPIRAIREKKVTYDVTIDTEIQHGTVTADKEKAAKDDMVTLTVTPDAGYATSELKYFKTEDPSEEVEISGNSFTMPDYAVTVTATFEESTAKVVPVKADNTSVEGVYTNGSRVAESTTEKDTYIVKKGADVTVKFQGDTGYFFKDGDNYLPTKDVVKKDVQADIEVPCPEGPVQGTSCGGGVYGFLNGGAMTMVGSGAATSLPFGKYSITSVKIGDGVTSLGANYFKGCPMIVTVTGGKDLTSVGSEAFYTCMSLQTISLDCSKPTGMDAAVKVLQAYVQGQGWTNIPVISYKGSVIMLYGKNDLKDEEWTKIGPAKNYKTMEETGYHYFQTRVEDEEVAE